MTYSSSETDEKGYSYTISTDSPWFDTVAAYAVSTYNSSADKMKTYSGNGLTLTQSAGDEEIYVVTGSSTAKDESGSDKTDEDGNVILDNLSAADFAEYLRAALYPTSGDGIIVSGTTIQSKETDSSGDETGALKEDNLSLGYYLVVETPTDASDTTTSVVLAELTTTNPDATITDKNVGPTIDKKQTDIVSGSTPTDYTDYALDTQIGDTVYYQITSKVPDTTGYTKYDYIVTDTLTKGLTLKTKEVYVPDVTIKVGGTVPSTGWTVEAIYGIYEENSDTPIIEKDENGTKTPYTSSDTSASIVGFKVSVDFVATSYDLNKPIEITYSATVNDNAKSGVEINTASLTYSNNPSDSTSTATVTDETKVYNAKVDVLKYTGTDKTALSGAQFVLYKEVDGAKQYYYYDATNKEVKWYSLGENETLKSVLGTENQEKITALTTGTYGKFSGSLTAFIGLEEGTYYLLETVAPDGYNLLKDPVTVDLTQETLTKSEGKTQTQTQLLAVGTTTIDGTTTEITIDTNRLDVTEEVENNSGTLLPSTGGMGTTIFYIIGGILVVAAAVLLITRRRMNRE